MKKIIAIMLTLVMLVSGIAATAYAGDAEGKTFSFNEDGKFTVVHLTDVQEGYPMSRTVKQFINEMLDTIKPDLVVLGGDNTVSGADTKADAIKELCTLFVNHETYFTFVFGNHDHQQMFDGVNEKAGQIEGIKEQLLAMYKQYGGQYCVAEDAVPELFGCATHNIPVMSSDGGRVAYNLYMFDSNGYYPTEDNDVGYDAVHEDEIEWYKGVAAQLREANGGEPVPALAFQHIVPEEAYEVLFYKSAIDLGSVGEPFEDGFYSYLPKVRNIKDGFLFEKPCPGYKNYGQFDAMVETGDVQCIFTGHDHTNTYTIEKDGIRMTNSGGCTYNSYGNNLTRGCRVIELDENGTYTTYTYTLAEAALEKDSTIATFGEISRFEAAFSVFGIKFMKLLVALLRIMFFMFY